MCLSSSFIYSGNCFILFQEKIPKLRVVTMPIWKNWTKMDLKLGAMLGEDWEESLMMDGAWIMKFLDLWMSFMANC